MTQIPLNTETDISNAALSAIKLTGILSLDADITDKAKGLRQHFAMTRDALQRRYKWNFNETYLNLPSGGTAPAFRFSARFPFCNDPYVLAIRDVPCLHRRHWKVQGRSVVANACAPLAVVASIRVTDVGTWDALFKAAMIASLAYAIAPGLARDDDTISRVATAAEKALAVATPIDAGEGAPDQFEEQDIILTRF